MKHSSGERTCLCPASSRPGSAPHSQSVPKLSWAFLSTHRSCPSAGHCRSLHSAPHNHLVRSSHSDPLPRARPFPWTPCPCHQQDNTLTVSQIHSLIPSSLLALMPMGAGGCQGYLMSCSFSAFSCPSCSFCSCSWCWACSLVFWSLCLRLWGRERRRKGKGR